MKERHMTAFDEAAPPQQVVCSIGSGILLVTFFAAYWAFAGGSFLSGTLQVVVFVIAALFTLTFFALGIYILLAARRFQPDTSAEGQATGKRIGRWFGLVFGLEMVLIALASILLARSQHTQYIVPVVALIVGLHFLPLARLFDVPAYLITGIALSLLGIVEIIALLFAIPLAGPDPFNWSRVGAQGAAIILWLTEAYVALRTLRLLRATAMPSRV